MGSISLHHCIMEYISRAMDFISLDTVDKVPRPVLATFAGIGTLWLGLKVVSYMRLLLSLFIFSGKSLRSYGKKGTWAVVTGASDGIGRWCEAGAPLDSSKKGRNEDGVESVVCQAT